MRYPPPKNPGLQLLDILRKAGHIMMSLRLERFFGFDEMQEDIRAVIFQGTTQRVRGGKASENAILILLKSTFGRNHARHPSYCHHVCPKFFNSPDGSPDQVLNRIKI